MASNTAVAVPWPAPAPVPFDRVSQQVDAAAAAARRAGFQLIRGTRGENRRYRLGDLATEN